MEVGETSKYSIYWLFQRRKVPEYYMFIVSKEDESKELWGVFVCNFLIDNFYLRRELYFFHLALSRFHYYNELLVYRK